MKIDFDSTQKQSLAKLFKKATKGNDYFADWARRAVTEPETVYQEVINKLGHLTPKQPWEVFSSIFNQDTPDKNFQDIANFTDEIFRSNQINKEDLIVDTATGTGSISRLLAAKGYQKILAFDQSKAMINEAKKLSSVFSQMRFMVSRIQDLKLAEKAKVIVWFDFSSNFALSENELKNWLIKLLDNLDDKGLLIFDVRTITGWRVDFFKQKITCFETENFQRLWINHSENKKISFDIFIRVKDSRGKWRPWQREKMTERKWSLKEVLGIVKSLPGYKLLNVYGDNLKKLDNNSPEPNLAYFLIKK